MTDYVIEAVKKARKFFHIEDFSGNFFEKIYQNYRDLLDMEKKRYR